MELNLPVSLFYPITLGYSCNCKLSLYASDWSVLQVALIDVGKVCSSRELLKLCHKYVFNSQN